MKESDIEIKRKEGEVRGDSGEGIAIKRMIKREEDRSYGVK